jgi:hypothetical protein
MMADFWVEKPYGRERSEEEERWHAPMDEMEPEFRRWCRAVFKHRCRSGIGPKPCLAASVYFGRNNSDEFSGPSCSNIVKITIFVNERNTEDGWMALTEDGLHVCETRISKGIPEHQKNSRKAMKLKI